MAYNPRRLKTTGLSEGRIISSLSNLLRSGEIRLDTHLLGIDILILAKGRDQAQGIEEKVRSRLGDCIYGEGGQTIEEVVGYLLCLRGLSLGVAESCTGGLIMGRLSDVPGSSEYLKGGVVAYSNEVKIDLLQVPRDLIEEKGAVSCEVAAKMAEGIVRLLKTGIGLGLTGVAGPGGGSQEHPTGEVFIAIYNRGEGTAWHLQLEGSRQEIRAIAAQAALDILRRNLLR